MQSKITLTLFTVLSLLNFNYLMAQDVSTLLNDPNREFESIHWHADGRIYAADYNNGRLYQVFTDGTIETLVTGFANIAGGGFDQDGNFYFSALSAGTIHRLNADGSNVLIASGLNQPVGILQSNSADTLYVTQYGNNSVAKVSISTGGLNLWANGNGINGPDGIIYDNAGDLLVANFNNNKIHSVDLDGNISPFSTIPSTGFLGYITKAGDYIYAPSIAGRKIYQIDMDGNAESIAGSGVSGNGDGTGSMASFAGPNGICSSPDGDTLLITDGHRVRMITDLNPVIDATSETLISQLEISPNPATDFINISFELETAQQFSWSIINQQGQRVMQDSLQYLNVGTNTLQVSIKTLSAGIYTLQLIGKQGKTKAYSFVKHAER